MFNALEYATDNAENLPEVKAIYSVSGLAELDEMLQNLRSGATPVMCVEDSSDGFLDLEDGNFAAEYNTVYILDKVKTNDSPDRRRAQELTHTIGKKFFKQMLADSVEFGDPAYGLERNRVDYARIGPVGNGYYGYSFSFIVRNENFSI